MFFVQVQSFAEKLKLRTSPPTPFRWSEVVGAASVSLLIGQFHRFEFIGSVDGKRRLDAFQRRRSFETVEIGRSLVKCPSLEDIPVHS